MTIDESSRESTYFGRWAQHIVLIFVVLSLSSCVSPPPSPADLLPVFDQCADRDWDGIKGSSAYLTGWVDGIGSREQDEKRASAKAKDNARVEIIEMIRVEIRSETIDRLESEWRDQTSTEGGKATRLVTAASQGVYSGIETCAYCKRGVCGARAWLELAPAARRLAKEIEQQPAWIQKSFDRARKKLASRKFDSFVDILLGARREIITYGVKRAELQFLDKAGEYSIGGDLGVTITDIDQELNAAFTSLTFDIEPASPIWLPRGGFDVREPVRVSLAHEGYPVQGVEIVVKSESDLVETTQPQNRTNRNGTMNIEVGVSDADAESTTIRITPSFGAEAANLVRGGDIASLPVYELNVRTSAKRQADCQRELDEAARNLVFEARKRGNVSAAPDIEFDDHHHVIFADHHAPDLMGESFRRFANFSAPSNIRTSPESAGQRVTAHITCEDQKSPRAGFRLERLEDKQLLSSYQMEFVRCECAIGQREPKPPPVSAGPPRTVISRRPSSCDGISTEVLVSMVKSWAIDTNLSGASETNRCVETIRNSVAEQKRFKKLNCLGEYEHSNAGITVDQLASLSGDSYTRWMASFDTSHSSGNSDVYVPGSPCIPLLNRIDEEL